VTVIAVAGVLTVGLANLIRHPLEGHAAVSRRAELVALADLALARMSRDLRRALPNSVRIVGSGGVLELLHTTGGARYRLDPGINDPGGPDERDHSAESDWLSFGGDASWNLIGRLRGFDFSHGTPLASGTRLAVFPTGSGIWSAAALDTSPGPITPAETRITVFDDGDEDQIRLDASHRFVRESPSRRLYVVDTPVTYLCDLREGLLWRISEYAITPAQPADLGTAPLSTGQTARVAHRVERCRFEHLPGTATRSGIVTLEIALASGGERVHLLHQVQVPNAP